MKKQFLTMFIFVCVIFIAVAQENLAKPFSVNAKGKNKFWHYASRWEAAKLIQCANEVFSVNTSASDRVAITSKTIIIEKSRKNDTIQLSVEFKGNGAAKNYEYGMVLNIQNIDGSKEEWKDGKTFLKFPKKVANWKEFKISFKPSKAVKAVKVIFLFKGKAEIELRNPQLNLIEVKKKI